MTTLYCGMDFHKNTTTFCIVDELGKQHELSTVKTAKLVSHFANRPKMMIGIEASGGTNDMVERLKKSGHDVRIINPNKFKAIGIGGKKTDEKDARAIADILRLSYIPEVYHKSRYAREIKSLIVGREMLVRTRVNMANHIRGLLREYGITMPAGFDKFLANAKESISRLESPEIEEHLFDLLERVKDLDTRTKAMEKTLEEIAERDERVKTVRTAPGIGLMTAVMLIAVLDDHSRFKDAKHFASYLGLVPREHSSGDKRRMGSITRSGSEILRRYFIHGARSTLMYTSKKASTDPNKMWALRLKAKHGTNKATVALAHRMARIAFAMIRDNATYGDIKERQTKEEMLAA